MLYVLSIVANTLLLGTKRFATDGRTGPLYLPPFTLQRYEITKGKVSKSVQECPRVSKTVENYFFLIKIPIMVSL